MSNQIKVLIADDHPLFSEGVAYSLASESDITVVGTASNGEEALHLIGELSPDMVLLDITMPGKGGIATAKEIAESYPLTKIIMLTVSEHEDDLMAALKAGACGYVLKGVSARELANVVRTVAAGDVYISPSLAAYTLRELSRPHPPDPLNELTDREHEVLSLLAEGLTNRKIGERLHLAEKTVKHYMTNILQKLHLRSRVEAALLAQRRGLGETKAPDDSLD